MNTINVTFSGMDTVFFNDTNEMLVKDYFDFIENNIKNSKIIDCNYDAANETYSYCYDGDLYELKISNNARHLRALLNLMALEKDIRLVEQGKKREENRKNELIQNAERGEIITDEAKQLYLDELKKQRKSLVFEQKEIDGDSDLPLSINIILKIIAFFGWIGFTVAIPLLFFYKIPTLLLIAFFACSMFCGGNYFTEKVWDGPGRISKWIARKVGFIPNVIRNLKNNLSKIKLINHKINWLRDYKLPTHEVELNRSNEIDNPLEDFAEKYINSIYLKLLQLDEDDKKIFISELIDRIKKFKDDLNGLKTNELTLVNEDYIRNNFVADLTELDQRISAKLHVSEYNKSLDTMVQTLQSQMISTGELLQSDGKVKVRKLSQ